MLESELVRRITQIEKRLDSLVMPEIGGWRMIPNPVVLTAPAASVTFANIPQIYRALVVSMQTRTDRAAENDFVMWRANADAGANYDWIYGRWCGNNTQAAASAIGANVGFIGFTEAANSRANNFAPCAAFFWGYALATQEKWSLTAPFVCMGDVSANTDMFVGIGSGRWRNTNAITSLTLLPNTGPNFVAGSCFAVYGVL